jgi:hypothetical protein
VKFTRLLFASGETGEGTKKRDVRLQISDVRIRDLLSADGFFKRMKSVAPHLQLIQIRIFEGAGLSLERKRDIILAGL